MSAFAFAYPAILSALIVLPAIWWLLRLTPPRPKEEVFPPLAILATVLKRQETPAKSPWWLTLLRMLMATAIILAIADPVINPRTSTLSKAGPLALIVDNSWATPADWDRRTETARLLIEDAERADVPVSIVFTSEATHDAVPTSAAVAREKLAAARPRPLVPDRARAGEAMQQAFQGNRPGTLALLSDGIATGSDANMFKALSALSPADTRIITGNGAGAVALTAASNGADGMTVTGARLSTSGASNLQVNAVDQQGRVLATAPLSFAAGAGTATAEIKAPFEIRNDFARLTIEGQGNAGAVHLLDDGFKRRRVALLAGDTGNDMQPLLLPLYYIQRALQPYADLIEPRGADLSKTIPDILAANPSAIIMADIGRLPPESSRPLQDWIARGGVLIRFAGPRLAAAPADDPLVPVVLRRGERSFGGALSWSEPQKLSEFPKTGPFAGMPPATDVLVNRQVLAEPTPDLPDRTWASLSDGTPLVTTSEVKNGRIVLVHVTADTSWSNLPLSGTFVDMLRRLVQLSHAGGAQSADKAGEGGVSLAPYRLLTADGLLDANTSTAKPISIRNGETAIASNDHPPGLYGSEDGFAAVNLLPSGATLTPIDVSAAGFAVKQEAMAGAEAKSLRPALFIAALSLLLLDSLIVLFLHGAFSRTPRGARAVVTVLLALAALTYAVGPRPAEASDAKPGDEQLLERLDVTHLAYVITGEADVDKISEQGLEGLSQFLTFRTALEPGDPVGVDISKDELSLYPIIYWPISATAPMPSAAAIARIDAYMRNGGTVLFDTRDQFSAVDSGMPSPNGQRLQELLANIDIPPLEPVPQDHVLTRSFFLLSSFPGRYAGSPLWVESRQESQRQTGRMSSSGDGVTPIMITGNDFAGAWAIDPAGSPILPTVPPDETQREYAYRAGVNIMMYMLTGNYKSDQVHVPALLERLGQ
ncbi:DUF4159 domain-containing protein [Rhizobium oryzicola]|uniref:DUF4159 domain-containing protein n=1 Tax=Rhizobium oryzicola TaxID=1232668 RepID=A0ABT8SV29_9HYPH|nr:DUF4159 domain-containing protein [Rhizobium oryzicola]MDO1582299.1 DUF4159 domain-containing protein [Rhizobium oryzicola]